MVTDINYIYYSDHFTIQYIHISLYCTPKTSMMLDVSYTSIKKIFCLEMLYSFLKIIV